MKKHDIVTEWWKTRLDDGSQVTQAKQHRDNGLLLEVTVDPRWFHRVDTDALFSEHVAWAKENGHDDYARTLTKSGFMLMFYAVTGATRSRTRLGQRGAGTRYVAAFLDLAFHREHYMGMIADVDT